MPDLRYRASTDELMDDPTVGTEVLEKALVELPRINRWLGGYRATLRTLDAYRKAVAPTQLHILDVGTGIGDYPARIVEWGLRRDIDIRVTAVDINPVTVRFARQTAESSLPSAVHSRIEFIEGDALELEWPDASFDICTSALFFHHLSDEHCISVLRQMLRLSKAGVLINDIQRHAMAYYGIVFVTSALPFSTMVRHDAPVSVRRAFHRAEVERVAARAGCRNAAIRWHWAFRWILTNLPQR
ncbi:MAG: methyltransferase domain-containing protein [Rhodothermales bacterium]|nr:methyltransferase domain-containing protein [Rhodothermales bacterium]